MIRQGFRVALMGFEPAWLPRGVDGIRTGMASAWRGLKRTFITIRLIDHS
jgi:hypothetical protein